MKEDNFNFLDEKIETQIDKPADFTSPESLYKKLVNIIFLYYICPVKTKIYDKR